MSNLNSTDDTSAERIQNTRLILRDVYWNSPAKRQAKRDANYWYRIKDRFRISGR